MLPTQKVDFLNIMQIIFSQIQLIFKQDSELNYEISTLGTHRKSFEKWQKSGLLEKSSKPRKF